MGAHLLCLLPAPAAVWEGEGEVEGEGLEQVARQGEVAQCTQVAHGGKTKDMHDRCSAIKRAVSRGLSSDPFVRQSVW